VVALVVVLLVLGAITTTRSQKCLSQASGAYQALPMAQA